MRTVPLPYFSGNGITTVPLSKGLVAIIDSADDDLILPHKWHASKSANAYYARASKRSHLQGIQMHRLITDAPAGMQVDHINGVTLDNRRANLRIVDSAGNMRSWGRRHSGRRFTGVYPVRAGWQARIYHGGRNVHLGYFSSEIEAAIAYDDACKETRGYRVNFPD